MRGNFNAEARTSMADPIVGKTKHGDLSLDQLAEMQPGLGRLMPEVSEAYHYAYYAAQGGNWRLARYYVRKVGSLFKLCAISRPKYAKQLDAYKAHTLDPLEKQISERDFGAFEKTYMAGIVEANRYHVETGHPEIVWVLPPEPPRHLDLKAQPEPGPKP